MSEPICVDCDGLVMLSGPEREWGEEGPLCWSCLHDRYTKLKAPAPGPATAAMVKRIKRAKQFGHAIDPCKTYLVPGGIMVALLAQWPDEGG